MKDYLTKLGFNIDKNKIIAPSYRSDIKTENDLAEEVARVIGYNNISNPAYKNSQTKIQAKNLELLKIT